jgi:lipopolysaccharide biosynthesis glycosyltransferase
MSYLNCGVLLMDAPVWRERCIKEALTETYLANPHLCRYFDQSAINMLLKGEFALLSPAWNFQQNYQAIGAEDIVRPRLVHFAGSAKPWRSDGFVFAREYRRRYRETLASTPFEDFFEPYWRLNRKQAKEAWRSVNRMMRGRETQSGIRRSDIAPMRAKLVELLAGYSFIDLPHRAAGVAGGNGDR